MSLVVPHTCWDAPGFKTCQQRVLGDAYNVCKSQGIPEKVKSWMGLGPEETNPDWEACYKKTSDELIYRNCVSSICPEGKTGSGVWPTVFLFAAGAGLFWYFTRKS